LSTKIRKKQNSKKINQQLFKGQISFVCNPNGWQELKIIVNYTYNTSKEEITRGKK